MCLAARLLHNSFGVLRLSLCPHGHRYPYTSDDSGGLIELHLQATYIIVKGGNLTIGYPGSPFLGFARITMCVNSPCLPCCGLQ